MYVVLSEFTPSKPGHAGLVAAAGFSCFLHCRLFDHYRLHIEFLQYCTSVFTQFTKGQCRTY